MHRARVFTGVLASVWVALFVVACQEQSTGPTDVSSGGLAPAAESAIEAELSSYLDAVNARLEADGADYRAVMAEAITAAESGEQGITVLAKNVGNKQLDFDFVPGDARRAWSGPGGTSITYAIDTTADATPTGGMVNAAAADAAIVRGHNTWEALSCSALGQTRNPDFGIDIGTVAFLFGLGGSPFVFADVQHSGWGDIDFAGGVLGVAFTFGFTVGDPRCASNPTFTDINNDGKCDKAFGDLYYDPSWVWYDDGVNNIDVESVALHETGHGLSQAHHGMIFIKNNGSLKRSPFSVMNAIYSQPLTVLQGTDNGGHCSIWANWPQQ